MARPFGFGVKAFITNPCGEFLFLKRSALSKHFAGTWELPGGKVDAGEAFDTALVREVAEETGLTIELDRVVGATQYEMPQIKLAVLFMEARMLSGDVRLSDEHDDYRWVPLDEITRLDLSDQLKAFLIEYSTRKAGQ